MIVRCFASKVTPLSLLTLESRPAHPSRNTYCGDGRDCDGDLEGLEVCKYFFPCAE